MKTVQESNKEVVIYRAHPKQDMLHCSEANEILFGGAAGPGKSKALRMEALRWALDIPRLQVYLFRRTFPELERNHIIPSLIEYPRSAAKWNDQKKRWSFRNGAMIHMCHCQHEKNVYDYQGAEIHLLLLDELTTFTLFIYQYLTSRVRCTLDIRREWRGKIPGIVCASNPGGIGHQFVKRRWVDFAKPLEIKRAPANEGGMLRQYIPALLEDNPTMMEHDPGYMDRLEGLPEPYRTAYKTGDWNVFMGQMFAFYECSHVVEPMPVPETAPVYMTFDWGFGKPYSIGWWWVDADDRLYRFTELYGVAPGQIDVGIRQTDEEIAEAVVKHEKVQGLAGRQIVRLCDPTCFNKKADYRGGGQGPSTAEVFSRFGLALRPADPSRILKVRQFHQRLRMYPDKRLPMMVVYRGCEAFIRTIPVLQADANNPEDVDTRMEDHCLAGDTRLITARGVLPICNLVGTIGRVLSLNGEWKNYSACRMTRTSTEIVQVEFEDGYSLRCTPDHLFMTIDGKWRVAVDLTDETCYAEKNSSSFGVFRRNFVPDHAKHSGDGIRVISVKSAGKGNVYCMQVDDTHAMAIDNGVIAHNCYDEAAQVCMARPMGGTAGQIKAGGVDRGAVRRKAGN